MTDSNIDSSTDSSLSGIFNPAEDYDSEHVFGPPAKSCSAGVAFEVHVLNAEDDLIDTYRFTESFVLIGRSPDCDLVLPHLDVSYRHAYIQEIFGRFVCVDLVSRTGTHWPEGPRPFGWFDESPVKIGPYRLQFSCSEESENYDSHSSIFADPEFHPQAFFRRLSEKNSLPDVSLEFLGRRNQQAWAIQWPIMLIGSSARCKLRLQHKSVSKVHCCLNLKPDGLWVADLLGKNGTLVDGEPVRSQRLNDGSVLKIGKYEFRVHYNSPSENLSQIQKDTSQPGPPAGVSEKAMSQLIAQIADMQQQFLEQSSQQTKMMLEFFSMMHTNQHNLLRDELNRVHKIEDELRELRELLAKSNQSGAATAEPQTEPNTSDSKSSALPRLEEPRPQSAPDASNSPTRKENVSEEQALSDSEESKLESNSGLSDEDLASFTEEPVESDSADVSSTDLDALAEEDNTSDQEESSEPVGLADESHHAEIMQRMFALEKEKENILKRMMRSVFQ
ncbi:MAG: FHA domain-containing protein [Planctomycetaceae bacterium]|nr:FHA domain-containing protein [Planctomycetaceae bacterium]